MKSVKLFKITSVALAASIVFAGCVQPKRAYKSHTVKAKTNQTDGLRRYANVNDMPAVRKDLDYKYVRTYSSAVQFANKCKGGDNAKSMKKFVESDSFYTTVSTTYKDGKKDKMFMYSIFTKNDGKRRIVACVQASDYGFPMLPIETFRETYSLSDDKSMETKMYINISKQIAQRGYAFALVQFSNGNAAELYYENKGDAKTKYADKFLKKGQYDESKYAFIAKGTGISTTKYDKKKNKPFLSFIKQ